MVRLQHLEYLDHRRTTKQNVIINKSNNNDYLAQ